MRVRKSFSHINGYVYTVTNYTYHGKMLTHLKRKSNEVHCFCDNQGRSAKVKYNGEMYTYMHNLQDGINSVRIGSPPAFLGVRPWCAGGLFLLKI